MRSKTILWCGSNQSSIGLRSVKIDFQGIMSSRHNYTNAAFCQNSEFYPACKSPSSSVSFVERFSDERKSFQSTSKSVGSSENTLRPHQIERSLSTRSVAAVHRRRLNGSGNYSLASQNTNLDEEENCTRTISGQFQRQRPYSSLRVANSTTPIASRLNLTSSEIIKKCNAGRNYALVPVDEFQYNHEAGQDEQDEHERIQGARFNSGHHYEILRASKRYAKSQDNLDGKNYRLQTQNQSKECEEEEENEGGEGPFSFHGSSMAPSNYNSNDGDGFPGSDLVQTKRRRISLENRCSPKVRQQESSLSPPIKHAFSSDFGSKSYLLVDNNSNQRYQMIPTAEDEEIVDDNHEFIQMHNGRAHRYAVIPAENRRERDKRLWLKSPMSGDDRDSIEEVETCLSNTDLNKHQRVIAKVKDAYTMALNTSTPCKPNGLTQTMNGFHSQPNTPVKNPLATKMLHELLSTPPQKTTNAMNKLAPSTARTPAALKHFNCKIGNGRTLNRQMSMHCIRSKSSIDDDLEPHNPRFTRNHSNLTPQRLNYDSVTKKAASTMTTLAHGDRTMAVIQPRVQPDHHNLEDDEEDDIDHLEHRKRQHLKEDSKNSAILTVSNSYPCKVANAAVTLAIIALMLVLGSSMNLGLSIYMIAHVRLFPYH